MKKKIRSFIVSVLSSPSDDCYHPISRVGKDLHEAAAMILGLFVVLALIGIFAGWEEVSVRGLAALLNTVTLEIAAAIGSHRIESRMTSFYVVKAIINATNAVWTSAVAVNIAVFYLFNKENDGLSNIVGLLFFAMVVFTIGSVIKMIFMIILAATNSKAIRPTESEGQET